MTIGTIDTSKMFACGFEMGSANLVPEDQMNSPSVGETAYTGSYGLSTRNNNFIEWKLSPTRSDIYVAVWVTTDGSGQQKLSIETPDGDVVYFLFSVAANTVNAYVGGALVESGTVAFPDAAWFHVEVYVSIANAGGEIKTWVDGIADINYTGDTQPGTSDQIEIVKLDTTNNSAAYWDDLHINSTRIYDRRVLLGALNSDDTSQLTASGGGDNYADVDDIPPDEDTTYVSTGTDAQKDLYGHSGVDLTDYTTPYLVTVWGRPRKTVANGDQIRLLLDSGGTETQGDWEDLLTSYQGYAHLALENDPATAAAWADEAAIDAVLIGIESNIP